jgi:F-type H+-transporting ATPase subunit alpha
VNSDAHQHFQNLVNSGQPVGEVISVDSFLVKAKGLQPINVHSMVVFEDGSRGFVEHVLEDHVSILHMGAIKLKTGMMAVLQDNNLVTKVGKDFVGRVITVMGEPLDGKGPIASDGTWPVFVDAQPIYAREALTTQMETGVMAIDVLFPIVRGQRLALLGDAKSGKTTLASQIAINQRDTDQIVVYVMVAKRRSDVDALLTRLTDNKALEKSIVIVSNIFESLVMSYLAPYVGVAMGEYFWQQLNIDTMVVYDDLTTHAHARREIALLSGTSPGRDSYPGDMFHAHSSLLERAGRLKKNKKHLTAIPVVLVDGGDISSYLPTNIMSITDGQWILDMEVFRNGIRPAMNVGLSVTRVGGVGHNKRQHKHNGATFKSLTAYAAAKEFATFGSDMSATAKQDMARGELLHKLLTQIPGETYTLLAQQLMFDMLFDPQVGLSMDIATLKKFANQSAAEIKSDADYDRVLAEYKLKVTPAPAAAAPPAAPANPPPTPGQDPAPSPPPAQPVPAPPPVPAAPAQSAPPAPAATPTAPPTSAPAVPAAAAPAPAPPVAVQPTEVKA